MLGTWIINRLDWKLVITWGVSGWLILWFKMAATEWKFVT